MHCQATGLTSLVHRNNKFTIDDTAWAQVYQTMRWFDTAKQKSIDVLVGGGYDITGEQPSLAAAEVGNEVSTTPGQENFMGALPDDKLHPHTLMREMREVSFHHSD